MSRWRGPPDLRPAVSSVAAGSARHGGDVRSPLHRIQEAVDYRNHDSVHYPLLVQIFLPFGMLKSATRALPRLKVVSSLPRNVRLRPTVVEIS